MYRPVAGLYQGAASADLNLIPVGSIDHVEVLQDGAAAQYGTDAIAGVINIILKDQSRGGSFTLTGGQYYKGDGETGGVQANVGIGLGERGFINLTGEARLHGRSQVGGIDYRALNPDGSIRDDLNPIDAEGVPGARNYPYINIGQGDAAYKIYNFTYNAGYDLSDTVKFYSFGGYSNRYATSYQNYRVPSSITKIVDGKTVALYPNGFSPQQVYYEDDYAFTDGLKGESSGWLWDISSTYGRNVAKVWVKRTGNPALYAETGETPTEFYTGAFKSSQWTSNLDISKEFDVGFAKPLNVAFGGEYRRDSFTIGQGDANSIYMGGALGYPGFQPNDAGTHSRRNIAGYINLSTDVVDGLHVDLAGRFEHYSDFGNATIGKLTARYDFSRSFAVRGTISTGFRAPTLQQEYYSATTVTPTYAIVLLPTNSPAAGAAGFSALKAEKSRSLSLGAVFNPAPGLKATIDIYQTTIDGRILSTGYLLGQVGSTVVSQGVLDAISDRGNVLGSNQSFVAMQIFTNAADTRTRGLDATLSYNFDVGNETRVSSSLGFNINRTNILRQAPMPAAVAAPAFGQTDLLGPGALVTLTRSTPRWRAMPSVTISHGRLNVTVRENVYGPLHRLVSLDGTGVNGTIVRMPVTAITDIDVNYDLTDNLTLSIGANNLFDRQAVKTPTVRDSSGVLRPVDGTYIYGMPMLASPYGINGGYYYAKVNFKF